MTPQQIPVLSSSDSIKTVGLGNYTVIAVRCNGQFSSFLLAAVLAKVGTIAAASARVDM